MRKIYVIRHCEAEGQPPEAQLTERGHRQANELAVFLSSKKINRIISSPYKRAVDSVQPLAKSAGLDIEMDDRLTERVLSTELLSDWFEKLRATFDDLDLTLEGGESSREAMNRIVGVVEEIFSSSHGTDSGTETGAAIIVTHGNLMSLLLKHYNQEFGFEDWKTLSNPDVYLLEKQDNQITYKREAQGRFSCF